MIIFELLYLNNLIIYKLIPKYFITKKLNREFDGKRKMKNIVILFYLIIYIKLMIF